MADTPNSTDGGAKPAAPTKPASPKAAKPKPVAAKAAAPASKPAPRTTAASPARPDASKTPRAEARTRFTAAIDEARAGVAALREDALKKGETYRRTAIDSTTDWVGDAKAMGEQARKRAAELAKDGKARASDGLSTLGKTVSDTAATIDEKLGKQYGDYARTAARTMQEAAAKLDAKDLGELGDDARRFVRESPAAAIGIAAVAGFFLARLFRGGSDDA